jgi:DNA-binding NtrC family response regulator
LIMPGMGGFQCLEQLMAINPSVKAIIVSGHHSHDLTGIPSHLGPRRFISKPFQIRDLLVAIRAELDTASR